MSAFNVFKIAGMGMAAQTVRLNTISSNIANANTSSGSKESVYHSRHPVFQSISVNEDGMDDTSMGVKVTHIVESRVEPDQRYEPNNPQADENGFVYHANVNPIQEMTDMISASRSYQNNAQLLMNINDLLKQTIQLGK